MIDQRRRGPIYSMLLSVCLVGPGAIHDQWASRPPHLSDHRSGNRQPPSSLKDRPPFDLRCKPSSVDAAPEAEPNARASDSLSFPERALRRHQRTSSPRRPTPGDLALPGLRGRIVPTSCDLASTSSSEASSVNSEYSPLEDDSVFLGFLNDALTGVSPGRLRRRVFLESELPSELCNFALDDEFYDPRRQAVFYALGFGMEYVGGMPPGRRINPVCAGKIFCQLIRLKEVTTHVRVGGEIGAAISMLISSLPRCIADGGASFADAIATVVAQPRTIELMDVSSPRSLQMTPDDVISAETLSSLLSFLHAEFEKLRFELLGFLASSHD